MKKIVFEIRTPYGDTFQVNEDAEIISKNAPEPSGKWKIKGIAHVRRSEFIPFSEITKEKIQSIDLLYKNGNPQWTVRDLDHGTIRTWGNTIWHGIKSIYFK